MSLFCRTFKSGESSICEIEKSSYKYDGCNFKKKSESTKTNKQTSEIAYLQSICRVSNHGETYKSESLPLTMVNKKLKISPISQIKPGSKIALPSKLPQLYHQKITLAKSSSISNLVPKIKVVSLESCGEKLCNTLEYLNPSKTHHNSKLPVIKHISAQNTQQGRAKNIHWNDTFRKNKEKQRQNKEVVSHVNVKSSAQCISKSTKSERMYHSLKAFAKAEISKNTDIKNLKKSQKLPPLASKTVSMSSSANSQSSCESYFDSSRESVVDYSNETVAIDFLNMQQENEKVRRVYSDSVELCTYRARDPPLQCVNLKQQCHHPDHYLQPIVPWMEVHNLNNRKTKNQRLRFPNAVKKVVTEITKKRSKQEREPYDPYKSAERQMMELLEPERDSPKLAPISMSPAPNVTIQSSPTSAFSKFLPLSSPESLFISEDDNCNHPSKDETKSIHSSEKSDSPLTICYDNYSSSKDSNQNPISLSTLSLCSTISIESIDGNRNGIRAGYSSAKVPEKKTPVPLRRTVSAYESRRGRDKGKLKMEDMLYGSSSERERYLGSPIITDLDKDIDNHSSSNSLFKSVMDEETLNAEQELLKSMSEFEKLLSSSSSPSPSSSSPPFKLFPSLVPSSRPDTDDAEHLRDFDLHAAIQTIGPDSAYSSLNRKSPVGGEQEKECTSLENTAVARFCHECGAKYPVLAAKFCCQCGVRRLVI